MTDQAFHFDLSRDPPTGRELDARLQRLKAQRREQIKYSCISDVLHAFVFIALFFGDVLSGYAILATVGLATLCAIVLATVTRPLLVFSDRLAIGGIALGGAGASFILLYQTMAEPLFGSLIAGLLAGSIIVVGATLGRRIKDVMVAIEQLRTIVDDQAACQELAQLCRRYPELAQYRETASRNLRPHLTYAELTAMREWAAGQHRSNP